MRDSVQVCGPGSSRIGADRHAIIICDSVKGTGKCSNVLCTDVATGALDVG
jgi:hypothetical protein